MQTAATEPDAELVRATLAGSVDAFETLVNRHFAVVARLIGARLRNRSDVGDAAQETFMLAYRHLPELRQPEKLRPWLLTIARNVIRKWQRQQLLRERFTRLDDQPLLALAKTDSRTRDRHRCDLIRQALAALSPEDRAATTLHYLVGMDQREVAAALQIPLGTVKSRLNRARRQLHRSMEHMTKAKVNSKPSGVYGRATIAGMRGVIHWKKLLGDGLDGWTPLGNPKDCDWRRSGEAIIGDAEQRNGGRLLIGDRTWTDFELSVLVTPISAGAYIHFRMTEDRRRCYMLDLLLGWQAIAISRVNLDDASPVQKLSVVNFPLVEGHEYDITLAARGASLTSCVDGELVNQVTDFTHTAGPLALSTWHSKTAYRDPRIRLMH